MRPKPYRKPVLSLPNHGIAVEHALQNMQQVGLKTLKPCQNPAQSLTLRSQARCGMSYRSCSRSACSFSNSSAPAGLRSVRTGRSALKLPMYTLHTCTRGHRAFSEVQGAAMHGLLGAVCIEAAMYTLHTCGQAQDLAGFQQSAMHAARELYPHVRSCAQNRQAARSGMDHRRPAIL